MEIYRHAPQKSSNLPALSLNPYYGMHLSVGVGLVAKKQTPHYRIYEACLRLCMLNLTFSAPDLMAWLGAHGIKISAASAQRVLKNTRYFTFAGKAEATGKRGRPRKLYRMVPQKDVDKGLLDLGIGATLGAPYLGAVELGVTRNLHRAMFGRYMENNETSSRAEQAEFWGISKPTLIRWTREVCEIIPEVRRIRSDERRYVTPKDGFQAFLDQVSVREEKDSRRYWLEVVTDEGEIRKLPCRLSLAEEWRGRGHVTICEQLPNRYIVRPEYRDPVGLGSGDPLPY